MKTEVNNISLSLSPTSKVVRKFPIKLQMAKFIGYYNCWEKKYTCHNFYFFFLLENKGTSAKSNVKTVFADA